MFMPATGWRSKTAAGIYSLTRKWGLDEGGGRCVLERPLFSMAEIGKNWQNLANNKTTMDVELDIV